MQDMQIDWMVVIIAAVLNMIIGYFWYSQWLFKKTWQSLCKHGSKEMRGDKLYLLYGFINSLVIAYFLAFFEGMLGVVTVTDGMFLAFYAWLGFTATTQIGSVIWCGRPLKLFVLNSGCKLVSYLVMGGVIAS